MTKLIIRHGDAVDTIDVNTKAKLTAAIKSGLPDVMPETVTILINGDETLVSQVENAVSVETLWENVRDNSLKEASKMLEGGLGIGTERAATLHQLINLARRAEKRLALGPENSEDTITMPTSTHKKIEQSQKAQKAQRREERAAMTVAGNEG